MQMYILLDVIIQGIRNSICEYRQTAKMMPKNIHKGARQLQHVKTETLLRRSLLAKQRQIMSMKKDL